MILAGAKNRKIARAIWPHRNAAARWRAGHKPGKMQSAAKEVKRAVTKYEWYKAHGICPTCGCRRCGSWTGAVSECLGKRAAEGGAETEKQSPEQKECHNRHRQRKTDLLHAFGVCVRCQRRDAAPDAHSAVLLPAAAGTCSPG